MFYDWILNFALQKKKGAIKNTLSKKKKGRKRARKKAPFFFSKGAKKKNEGQRPFFGGKFLGALLSNKPKYRSTL